MEYGAIDLHKKESQVRNVTESLARRSTRRGRSCAARTGMNNVFDNNS